MNNDLVNKLPLCEKIAIINNTIDLISNGNPLDNSIIPNIIKSYDSTDIDYTQLAIECFISICDPKYSTYKIVEYYNNLKFQVPSWTKCIATDADGTTCIFNSVDIILEDGMWTICNDNITYKELGMFDVGDNYTKPFIYFD